MVWWVDVPDSDQGDFGRQRAVDIFSFMKPDQLDPWIKVKLWAPFY